MTSAPAPKCVICKHKFETLQCDAFPDGIPDDILFGFDHSEPYPGDNGIRFEASSEEELQVWEIFQGMKLKMKLRLAEIEAKEKEEEEKKVEIKS